MTVVDLRGDIGGSVHKCNNLPCVGAPLFHQEPVAKLEEITVKVLVRTAPILPLGIWSN